MENVQGKKPAEWFKQLKEPYRSQAIENINSESINLYYKSIIDALYDTFTWVDTPQGDKQWVDIHNSIKAGETTYLEPENVSLINEVNNTQVTEQQNQIEPEKVETDWKAKFEEMFEKANYWHKRFEEVEAESQKEYTEMKRQLIDRNNELDAKFEELQKRYEVLVTEAHKLDILSGEICDKYIELKQQVESGNNEEKVYFYQDIDLAEWNKISIGEMRALDIDINKVIANAQEDSEVYEAVKIGVKKSILVNENS